MTNSDAIREFAEVITQQILTYLRAEACFIGEFENEIRKKIEEQFTARISEHYVAKAAYIALENTLAKAEAKNLELLQQRDELKEALTELSGLFEYLHGGAIVGKSIRQRAIAAIKNAESSQKTEGGTK